MLITLLIAPPSMEGLITDFQDLMTQSQKDLDDDIDWVDMGNVGLPEYTEYDFTDDLYPALNAFIHHTPLSELEEGCFGQERYSEILVEIYELLEDFLIDCDARWKAKHILPFGNNPSCFVVVELDRLPTKGWMANHHQPYVAPNVYPEWRHP